jgi:hypothetical protein
MSDYLRNLAVIPSQAVHALFGGNPDLTVSAAVYVAAALGSERARFWLRVLDRIYWWDEDHCRESWLRDVGHASRVMRTQHDILRKQRAGL